MKLTPLSTRMSLKEHCEEGQMLHHISFKQPNESNYCRGRRGRYSSRPKQRIPHKTGKFKRWHQRADRRNQCLHRHPANLTAQTTLVLTPAETMSYAPVGLPPRRGVMRYSRQNSGSKRRNAAAHFKILPEI